MASPPAVAAAALLAREDGRVLLVRHRDDDGAFAGRWSLPMDIVAPHELVEEALERALRGLSVHSPHARRVSPPPPRRPARHRDHPAELDLDHHAGRTDVCGGNGLAARP